MFRLQRYRETEREASEKFNESCRMRSIPETAGGAT